MKMAILGAGGIAAIMAETIRPLEDVESYAIGSRDLGKAQAFADKYGFRKAYGSYEEMLEDPEIDLVYIAVPHSHHHMWTLASLNAGKHVLCEKAFAVNERQTREMIELSEKKGLLLAEAIWTRYMPSRQIITEIVERGDIGRPRTISANLGYRIDMNERMVRPELAGGCLLDLTVYTLNFASMVWGDDIRRIAASCVKTDTGVDGQDTVMIEYQDDRMASLFTTMYTLTNRMGLICGTEGFIEVQNINNPEQIRVYSPDRNGPELRACIDVPEQITGYEYEVLACKKAIEEGRIECPEMPHSQTIQIMCQMDQIRKQFGIVYPGE
ncbi:MAG TPA: gfo/Idh/MocA family oxidoreductase [Lachnospiraceae bacterium]|nr:gfo/Idh/MocA family oxidoreductase [Lachnospiraceae bacterium]